MHANEVELAAQRRVLDGIRVTLDDVVERLPIIEESLDALMRNHAKLEASVKELETIAALSKEKKLVAAVAQLQDIVRELRPKE